MILRKIRVNFLKTRMYNIDITYILKGARAVIMEGTEREVVETAMEAGHILLENGAEIFRVEETINRVCRHYGVESCNAFVLSNGIFVTAGSVREEIFAKVQHIPVSGSHLNRVAAVNQLSREIAQGQYTIGEVRQRLEEIRRMPGKTKRM